MNIQATITNDATPAIAKLRDDLKGVAFMQAVGGGVRVVLRDHFAAMNSSRPNKLGFPRTNFWSQVRNSVQAAKVMPLASASIVKIEINHVGIRQRVQGGTIKPVRGQYLTIPANAKAYGHRAREFPNLRFGFAENRFGGLSPALVSNSETITKEVGRKRKDGTRRTETTITPDHEVYFWLVRKVFQPADPSALPTQQVLQAAAVRGADQFAKNMIARSPKNSVGGAK